MLCLVNSNYVRVSFDAEFIISSFSSSLSSTSVCTRVLLSYTRYISFFRRFLFLPGVLLWLIYVDALFTACTAVPKYIKIYLVYICIYIFIYAAHCRAAWNPSHISATFFCSCSSFFYQRLMLRALLSLLSLCTLERACK